MRQHVSFREVGETVPVGFQGDATENREHVTFQEMGETISVGFRGSKTTENSERVRFLELNENVPVGFRSVETRTAGGDYQYLSNKPSINGVTLVGALTDEDLHIHGGDVLPEEGNIGDFLMKSGRDRDNVSWVTPASSAEQDNTRPITAAAVYTEIGNINALLATI